MRPTLLLLALLLPLGHARADGTFGRRDAFPPGAPPMPVCNAPREGVAACLGGKSCLCRFERGGSLTGRPDRFGWDCGPLRPACTPAPADLPPQVPPVQVFPQVTLPGPAGEEAPLAPTGRPFPAR